MDKCLTCGSNTLDELICENCKAQEPAFLKARGLMTADERWILYWLAQHSTSTMLNIGVRSGAALHCMSMGNPDAILWGVDRNLGRFKPQIEFPSLILTLCDASLLLNTWTAPISLLFLDGGADPEQVQADMEFTKHVMVGGYVVLHDAMDCDGTHFARVAAIDRVLEAWDWTAGQVWEERTHMFGDFIKSSMRIWQRAA